MKKIITFLFFTLLVVASNAQFSKGTILLGGDLFANSYHSKDGANEYKTSGFGLSPVFAVAIKDNRFFGVSLSYGHSKNDQPSPYPNQKADYYGASIFYRSYKPVLKKLNAFVQSGIQVNHGKTKVTQGTDYYYTDKNFSASLNVTPGISLAVSKKLFLETGLNNIVSLGYQHTKTTGNNPTGIIDRSSNGFNISSSLGGITNNLYFGFRFFIPKNSG